VPASAFTQRLDLLEGAGQVSQQARQLAAELIETLEAEFNVALDEDNGAMLVTHLVVSLSRIESHQQVTDAPAELMSEVQAFPRELDFIREHLNRFAEKLNGAVPETEIAYMTAHLCALTQR
jgi:transcriptional regulatory protein LevR